LTAKLQQMCLKCMLCAFAKYCFSAVIRDLCSVPGFQILMTDIWSPKIMWILVLSALWCLEAVLWSNVNLLQELFTQHAVGKSVLVRFFLFLYWTWTFIYIVKNHQAGWTGVTHICTFSAVASLKCHLCIGVLIIVVRRI